MSYRLTRRCCFGSARWYFRSRLPRKAPIRERQRVFSLPFTSRSAHSEVMEAHSAGKVSLREQKNRHFLLFHKIEQKSALFLLETPTVGVPDRLSTPVCLGKCCFGSAGGYFRSRSPREVLIRERQRVFSLPSDAESARSEVLESRYDPVCTGNTDF